LFDVLIDNVYWNTSFEDFTTNISFSCAALMMNTKGTDWIVQCRTVSRLSPWNSPRPLNENVTCFVTEHVEEPEE
jgi:hypothetical protein